MNDTGPEACPPLERSSREERITERLVPVPLPHLNSIPSVLARSRIDSIRSWTELMKQAEHWGFSSIPQLNQTGLLNEAFCSTKRWQSSASKVSASSGEA